MATRSPLERLFLTLAGALPPAVQRRLATRLRGSSAPGLAADIALLVELTNRFGWPDLDRLTVPEARREAEREARVLSGARLPGVTALPLLVEGPTRALSARLFIPAGAAASTPGLLYLHGGGWVFGSPATHDRPCRFIARHTGMRVLSCSYRLAPENPFPAAVEDSLAALAWLRREAGRLGVDPRRIAIAGDSAGGNLAFAASALSSERPWRQLLLYPVLDLSREHPSYESADGPLLTATQMRWFRSQYLASEEDARDPRASPLLSGDLSDAPSTYLAVAGFDPLRDEGLAFAARLREAGADVTLAFSPAQAHAFVELTGVCRSARAGMRAACRWLARP